MNNRDQKSLRQTKKTMKGKTSLYIIVGIFFALFSWILRLNILKNQEYEINLKCDLNNFLLEKRYKHCFSGEFNAP